MEGALNWTAIVAASVFVLTQVFDVIRKYIGEKRERAHLARALSSEIRITLSNGGEASDPKRMRYFIEKNSIENINAYSFAESESRIYKSNIGNIGKFPKDLVEDIVRFYSYIDIISEMVRHFKTRDLLEADQHVQNNMKEICIRAGETAHELAEKVTKRLKEYY